MSKTPPAIKALRKRLAASKVFAADEQRLVYSADVTKYREAPSAVVFAENVNDVIQTVKIAAEFGLPITPRGAGTGMSGGAVPSKNAIALSLERMKRIIGNPEKKVVLTEPGVITSKLQDDALKRGLFYPPDPSSYKNSTIGGNIAENAGGLRCVKYGVTADYVLGTEFVNSEGELIATGCLDNYRSDLDLTQILCASEGTLGVVVKAALKLIDAPPAHITLRVEFPSAIEAGRAVTAILSARLRPCLLEFIDRQTLEAVTKFVEIDISPDSGAVLLIEFDDDIENNRFSAEKASQICRDFNCSDIMIAEAEEEREILWKLRRYISPSLTRLASGKINEDVAVPRSKIADLVSFVHSLAQEIQLPIPLYGHAGDGNVHVNFMYDLDDNAQYEKALQGVEVVLKEVVRLGGTISGEHGIGLSKRDFLNLQFEPDNMDFQRMIKMSFDEKAIFNPGKIFPAE